MKDGEILQVDSPEHLLRRPANEFVSEFIGEDRMKDFAGLPSIEKVMDKAVTEKPSRGLAGALKVMRKYKVDSLIVTEKGKYKGIAKVWHVQKKL